MSDIVINARFLTQAISGVQRHAAEMSLQLKLLIPEVKFVAPRNIRHAELAGKLDVAKIGRGAGHLWEQVDLPRYLGKQNYPLLVNLANTAPIRYRRSIVTVHDLAFLENPAWFARSFRYAYRFLIPRICASAVKVVTVSEFSRGEIERRLAIPRDKMAVINGGVSDSFAIDSEPGVRFDENSQRGDGDYILFVGSLDPRKNLARLLEAFRLLKMKDTRLKIVGASHRAFAQSDIGADLATDPRIEWLGSVDDSQLRTLYRNARLFVFPSLYEGFGLPPLEAMGSGCPCVVSKTASLPEVCGEAALYVDPTDIQDIAAKIKQGLTDVDLRRTLIRAGKERAATFTWERSARALARLIDEVRRR